MANTIASLQWIDFRTVFEPASPDLYRTLVPPTRELLLSYIGKLIDPERRVAELAASRTDAPELLDSLLDAVYPPDIQDARGKVPTDPELAALLARLTIQDGTGSAIDPCCGDGPLIAAAYDVFAERGLSAADALAAVRGIEADPISVRLAEVRLAFRNAANLTAEMPTVVLYADMFATATAIASADAVLMNPPFRRYEEQDGTPIPAGLRTHYQTAIENLGGGPTITAGGQPNLYNYYVEFAIRAAHPGAVLGIILDNKWYQNQYGEPLRQLLLDSTEILGVVEYPHSFFFLKWIIATSMLVVRKVDAVSPEHQVQFVRCKSDPRGVNLLQVGRAFRGEAAWPMDWASRSKPQSELEAKVGWKSCFASGLANDFRLPEWPPLPSLFARSRRGSLQKEGGGIEVFEFPFNRSDYGPRRCRLETPKGFKTGIERELTDEENRALRDLAAGILPLYRGWALRNADDAQHFELTADDVQQALTLEPPILRENYASYLARRVKWGTLQEQALAQLRGDPATGAYVNAVEELICLRPPVLSTQQIWNVLREPVAGELVIPRKTRSGHRVYLNPFAFDLTGRQVRVSSNFVTYGGCTAICPESGLDRGTAAHLIVAFLVSSFGQLQFEMEGYNREGLLALEKEQLKRIRVFDPRWVRAERRPAIVAALHALPFPVPSDRRSTEMAERNELDALFAEEIHSRYGQFAPDALLSEIHVALDEWLDARQP